MSPAPRALLSTSGENPAFAHERRLEAERWVVVAIEDVAVARLCLGADEPKLGSAAYHCQQAVEKLLKGLLVLANIPFPKTHDLRRLGTTAAVHYPDRAELLSLTFAMTTWGYAYRYPGPEDYALPAADELLRAVVTISQIADFTRSLLVP
jgi:HEPN domain-containing protein